jgi:type II secretory pathway pseudopilin PulG
MQTQSHILKRGGFALIAAVFLLILISSMLLTMLSLSTETSKRTVNDYLNEQAVLLAYGATEQAVLAITGTDPASGCLQSIGPVNYPDTGSPIFTVTTTMRYMWSNGLTAASCLALDSSCRNYIDDTQAVSNQLTTDESGGAVIIDVVVQTPPGLVDEPVRFHRRTLQKL